MLTEAESDSREHKIQMQLPGVYELLDDTGTLAYLGETVNLKNRLRSHAGMNGEQSQLRLSFCELPDLKAKCERLEIETDLIGGYYSLTFSCPSLQFGH